MWWHTARECQPNDILVWLHYIPLRRLMMYCIYIGIYCHNALKEVYSMYDGKSWNRVVGYHTEVGSIYKIHVFQQYLTIDITVNIYILFCLIPRQVYSHWEFISSINQTFIFSSVTAFPSTHRTSCGAEYATYLPEVWSPRVLYTWLLSIRYIIFRVFNYI